MQIMAQESSDGISPRPCNLLDFLLQFGRWSAVEIFHCSKNVGPHLKQTCGIWSAYIRIPVKKGIAEPNKQSLPEKIEG